MKKINMSFQIFSILLLLMFCIKVNAQVLEKAGNNNGPGDKNKVQNYFPGTGSMVAGDLWWSFMPENTGPYYGEGTASVKGIRTFIRIGNFDRAWTTPMGNYPIAYTWNYWWDQQVLATVFDNDPTFNPKQVGGVDNQAFAPDPDNSAATYNNCAIVTYKSTLQGATDATRTYAKEAYYVDPVKRNHLVYEAGFVTNVGLDVKIRAHQFAAPNWNNLNDFIQLDISFKNTGNVDINMDGTFEKTNHKIQGLALTNSGEYSPVTNNDVAGARASAWAPARDVGYIGDLDPTGSPWDFNIAFNGNSNNTAPNPAGKNDLGFAPFANKWYTDLWQGWTWVAAKKGGLPTDVSKTTTQSVDKPLVWGTPAIGTGAQRGWFVSGGTLQNLGNGLDLNNPKWMFGFATGTYYTNGGKDNDKTKLDWTPNPKFFSSGTKGDITTFVPKKTSGFTDADRPNGDRKLLSEDGMGASAFLEITENGNADKNASSQMIPYPTGWGKLSKGFTRMYNWDGELFQGIGPFSLDVNEEMTVSLILVAGYRLEGIQKAVRAGRFAYDNNLAVPEPPPLPDLTVNNTDHKTITVEWDNRAENDPGFSGYKIWRSCQFIKYDYLKDGMRIIDRYQEQNDVGADKSSLKKPVNPMFDAYADAAASSSKGQYPGYTWGTYELVKNIPKSQLSSLPAARTAGYKYLFEDVNVVIGGSYWYYISAYKDGSFTGPGGETTTRIETHSTNRNGASGLWEKTWPFATANGFFPKTTDADYKKRYKDIGAVQILSSPQANIADLNSGAKIIGLRPNPYKRAALHDNFTNVYDHKLLFYNLPSSCKITITDVAGQIINIINFSSSDPNNGSVFWDMFSKDGMEVASGLYLYYVEWAGGSYKNKFAILR